MKWDSDMKETKFKKTNIGQIPEDWECSPLRNHIKIGNGRDYKHLQNGKIPVYGTGGLMTYVSDYLYDGETVCIGRKGTIDVPQYHQGKIWTVDTLFYTHSFEQLEPKFLYYLFCSIDWYKYNTATGVPSLTSNTILDINIPLPSPFEQKRIAKALSDIDDLISSLSKLIEKKKNIKVATMQQLLTGKKRLKGFSEPWRETEIGKLGRTYNGLSGKSANDFGHGAASYITFLNVLNNPKIDTSIFEKVDVKEGESQNIVRKGDLLFNTSSETPDEVGICSAMLEDVENLYLNSFCFGFRPNEDVDSLFMSYWFRGSEGRNLMITLAQGSTRYNLSKDSFMKSVITIPSPEEQKAIANILNDMDVEIQAIEQKRAKYESIKKGMMQELLTGKIRLV